MKLLHKFTALVTATALLSVCPVARSGQTVSAAGDMTVITCVGDSITYGSQSSNPETCSYPAQLQELLDKTQYKVYGYGVSGATATTTTKDRTPYWNTENYTKSLASSPDKVVIMLGTNDVIDSNWDPAGYESDLTKLVQTYQELDTAPTVYLATPPTAFDDRHPETLQNVAVPTVKRVAEATGAVLIDINALTADMKAYFPDNIHPNDGGYLKLATFFYEGIFGTAAPTATFVTEPGNKVTLGVQQITADSTGRATLFTGPGTKSVRVDKDGAGFAYVDVDIDNVSEIDLTDLSFRKNLALEAGTTVMDCGRAHYNEQTNTASAACDGDTSTGWQLGGDGKDYASGVWLGYDLGQPTAFDIVEVVWEAGTRSAIGQYTIEISDDGVTWTPIADATYQTETLGDRVSFNTVTSRYVRLNIASGSNSKYYPKVYELRVLAQVETVSSVPGDVDLDGEVSAADLTILARHVGGIEKITDATSQAMADMDGNAEMEAGDLTALAREVGKID